MSHSVFLQVGISFSLNVITRYNFKPKKNNEKNRKKYEVIKTLYFSCANCTQLRVRDKIWHSSIGVCVFV